MGIMRDIKIRYFAAAAEAAGVSEEQWSCGEPATLTVLREQLSEKYGSEMARILRTGSFLVDGTVRRDGGAVQGSTVDVLPPFAGG